MSAEAGSTLPARQDAGSDTPPDATRIMAELEREVRARRRSGELPDDLERELDRAFEAVAPPGATGSGFDAVVDRAESAAFVDPVGPVASRFPGVALLRRVLRKLMAFYVEHVVRQVSGFGTTVVRALRLLGRRVDALERTSALADPALRELARPLAADPDPAPWCDLVVERTAAAAGRVLHADCGRGAMLVALRDAGIDAYGVDPRPDAAAEADARDVEVRSVETLDHLAVLAEGTLGGLVLSGVPDRTALGDLLALVDHAAKVLAAGAPLVVIGTHPDAWHRTRSAVAADLAPGRPLHPETWAHLLSRRSFSAVEVHLGPAASPLAGVDDEAADANFRRIADLLFGPETFAVTAVRAGEL